MFLCFGQLSAGLVQSLLRCFDLALIQATLRACILSSGDRMTQLPGSVLIGPSTPTKHTCSATAALFAVVTNAAQMANLSDARRAVCMPKSYFVLDVKAASIDAQADKNATASLLMKYLSISTEVAHLASPNIIGQAQRRIGEIVTSDGRGNGNISVKVVNLPPQQGWKRRVYVSICSQIIQSCLPDID